MDRKSTVLIVDDQEAMRDALEGVLSNQGYILLFATNGQEAIDLAKQFLPDVILLDVMMPDMDGFETCQRLRADSLLAEVPIVMVTALDDQDSRLRGIEVGADDFISKPYRKLELRARIRTITKLNRYQHLLNEQFKFKCIFENTNEAYLLLNDDNQIIYANAKARLYLSLPTYQVDSINENFLKLVAKHYHQVNEPSETPLPINEKLIQFPRYIVRPDTETAQPFWLKVDRLKIFEESKGEFLVHLNNVTDSILTARQNWVFEGQITHKLKTPLFPILSGIDFLIKNHAKITTDVLEGFLKMAHAGANRLYAQIEEILNYTEVSRIGESTQEPCSVADLPLIVTTVQKMLNIESLLLKTDSIEKSNFFIPISCTAVEIILTELFSNAKKFHPTKMPTIEFDVKTESDSVCLQIRDDGIHLSPEQLVNMWRPYYQGEKYFTGEAKGMGLGLSMVGSLIWEVGGTCQTYNHTEGKGIIIELTMPIKN